MEMFGNLPKVTEFVSMESKLTYKFVSLNSNTFIITFLLFKIPFTTRT